jgi:hypothetical protein
VSQGDISSGFADLLSSFVQGEGLTLSYDYTTHINTAISIYSQYCSYISAGTTAPIATNTVAPDAYTATAIPIKSKSTKELSSGAKIGIGVSLGTIGLAGIGAAVLFALLKLGVVGGATGAAAAASGKAAGGAAQGVSTHAANTAMATKDGLSTMVVDTGTHTFGSAGTAATHASMGASGTYALAPTHATLGIAGAPATLGAQGGISGSHAAIGGAQAVGAAGSTAAHSMSGAAGSYGAGHTVTGLAGSASQAGSTGWMSASHLTGASVGSYTPSFYPIAIAHHENDEERNTSLQTSGSFVSSVKGHGDLYQGQPAGVYEAASTSQMAIAHSAAPQAQFQEYADDTDPLRYEVAGAPAGSELASPVPELGEYQQYQQYQGHQQYPEYQYQDHQQYQQYQQFQQYQQHQEHQDEFLRPESIGQSAEDFVTIQHGSEHPPTN